jgi:hypothetical protein
VSLHQRLQTAFKQPAVKRHGCPQQDRHNLPWLVPLGLVFQPERLLPGGKLQRTRMRRIVSHGDDRRFLP